MYNMERLLINLLIQSERPKKNGFLIYSAGSLFDEPIPLDEIPKYSNILKPTKPTKPTVLDEPIPEPTKAELTYKEWEDWLHKPQPQPEARVVDKDRESFKERINELYDQNKITKIYSKSSKKFNAFFDAFHVTGGDSIDKTVLSYEQSSP